MEQQVITNILDYMDTIGADYYHLSKKGVLSFYTEDCHVIEELYSNEHINNVDVKKNYLKAYQPNIPNIYNKT